MVREIFALGAYSALLALGLAAPGLLALGCDGSGSGSGTTTPAQSCVGGCSFASGCGRYCNFSTFACNRAFCCPSGQQCGDGNNGPCGQCF